MLHSSIFSKNINNHEKWQDLVDKNTKLLDEGISHELLIRPAYRSRKLADLRIREFLKRENKNINDAIPLPEQLKKIVDVSFSENAIQVLNSIGRTSTYLGDLDVTYYISFTLHNREALVCALADSNNVNEIFVSLPHIDKARSMFETFNLNKKSQYGFFDLSLDFACRSVRYGATYHAGGHRASGFVDNNARMIYIYDGANWITCGNGIEKLNDLFRDILPDYKLQILAKSHQTKYGTCRIFQPVVTYLMILYMDPKLICDFLDKIMSGDGKESIIDLIAISIFNYHKLIAQPALKSPNEGSSLKP